MSVLSTFKFVFEETFMIFYIISHKLPINNYNGIYLCLKKHL